VRAAAFLTMFLIFEKASLPLCVTSSYISCMTSVGTEDGLRTLAYGWL
jgi:hypothetical protein